MVSCEEDEDISDGVEHEPDVPDLNGIDNRISIRGFFERVLTEQKEAREVLSRETKEAMRIAEAEREKAAANIRRALEENMKAGDERLQDHITHQVEQVRQALASLNLLMSERDMRMDDRFKAAQEAIQKAESSLAVRLEQMNEFRAQINQERGRYITRDFMDEQGKQTEQRLGALEGSISRLYGGIAVVFAIGIVNAVRLWTG